MLAAGPAGPSDPSTSPTILAAGQDNPANIAVDADYVYFSVVDQYWTSTSAIKRVAKTGGAVEQLASWNNDELVALVLGPSDVIFAVKAEDLSDAYIRKVPKSGGAVTELVATTDEIYQLATDGTYVFYARPPMGTVDRLRISDGDFLNLVDIADDTPFGVATDGIDVFISQTYEYNVNKVPIGGGLQTLLATNLDAEPTYLQRLGGNDPE